MQQKALKDNNRANPEVANLPNLLKQLPDTEDNTEMECTNHPDGRREHIHSHDPW